MENRTLGPTKSIPPCSKNLELVFWVLNGTAGVIILSGNFITILVLVTNRRLRQNYVNIFLVNLAVADLMMAVFVIPGYAVFCNGCNKYALSKHCWILAGIKDVAFGSTVFNLAAVSFDRFLAVLWPLHYYNYMTKRSVSLILTGVWVFSIFLASLRHAWLHTKPEKEAQKVDKIYNSTLMFAFALMPVVVISGMNVKVIQEIRRQNRLQRGRIHVRQTETGETRNRLKRMTAVKGTISCVLIVFTFLISWLPLAFVNFSFVFGRPDLVSGKLEKTAWFFIFVQSSANPFIYSFLRSDFRQASRSLICCQLELTQRSTAIRPLK